MFWRSKKTAIILTVGLIEALVIMALAGCGSLESRALNQACTGVLTVDQLNTALHGVVADYDRGVTYSTQIYAVNDYCGNSGDCKTCLFAIVDVVYSQ